MRVVRKLGVVLGVASIGVLGLPALSTAAPALPTFFYHITVTPTSALPGHTVKVTGTGEYTTGPYSGDNCDDVTITVTVTYYTATGKKTTSATTKLGSSNGDGDLSGTVTIPAGAAPTSESGHDAVIVASCPADTQTTPTYTSNPVTVDVEGTAPHTTTTTTAPTTTTTTTKAATTTTTAPATTAPAATAISGSPNFTG